MSEAYTMADESSKVNVRCPFPDTRRSNCIGKYCMAWVREIGPDGKDTGRGRCGMVGSLHSPEKLKFTQEDGRELTEAVHHLFDFLHRYTAPISPLQKRDLKRATALSDGTAVYSEGRIKVPELCEIEKSFLAFLPRVLMEKGNSMEDKIVCTTEINLDGTEIHSVYEVTSNEVTPLPGRIVWENGKWKVRTVTIQQKQEDPHE